MKKRNLNEFDQIAEIKKIKCPKKRLRVLKRLKTQVDHELLKLKKDGFGIEPPPFVQKIIIRERETKDATIVTISKV